MIGSRWLRAAASVGVGGVAVLPAAGLMIAVLVDCGPDGEARFSLFPIALLAFDPFAWTCVRNSLIFATGLTALALIGGLGIGGAISVSPGRVRGVSRALAGSMLAAPPACMALGLLGLSRSSWPRAWPPGFAESASGGLGLEDGSGWPAWLLWIGSSAPAAVAAVAISTAADGERIAPTRRDTARLAGAGRVGAWLGVSWPMIRPAAARAAAVIFPLALFEPGAPWILGLRRTLAFQIVETAARPDPFPRIAVWTALAAGCSVAGRWLLRWWGGPPLLDAPDPAGDDPLRLRSPARQIAGMAISPMLVVVVSAAVGWLPIVGLFRIVMNNGSPTDGSSASLSAALRRATAPPLPQLLLNSLILGLAVGAVVMILARVLRPDPGTRPAPTLGSRLVRRFALMPPLVQGVGLLALLVEASWLLGAARGWPSLPDALKRMAELAPELDVRRNPWPILLVAVALSVGSRLLQGERRAAERRPAETRSGLDAALLAGPSRRRARALATIRPAARLGGWLLASLLAAVNLTPALLFAPWMDGRTAAPGILALADTPDVGRAQAAALGLCVIAGSLAALVAARLASAPPPEWDADPP